MLFEKKSKLWLNPDLIGLQVALDPFHPSKVSLTFCPFLFLSLITIYLNDQEYQKQRFTCFKIDRKGHEENVIPFIQGHQCEQTKQRKAAKFQGTSINMKELIFKTNSFQLNLNYFPGCFPPIINYIYGQFIAKIICIPAVYYDYLFSHVQFLLTLTFILLWHLSMFITWNV